MGPRWKLIVEGLGKIERAEVEVRPLMLFVGENNSGKSYLATLLWGLLKLPDQLDINTKSEAFRACDAWLTERLNHSVEPLSHPLIQEHQHLFVRLFNEIIQINAAKISKASFNSDDVAPRSLAVAPLDPASITLHVSTAGTGAMPWEVTYDDRDVYVIAGAAPDLGAADRTEILTYICAHICIGTRSALFAAREPVFLPASRTGFMLLYKAAVKHQIGRLAKRRAREELPIDLTTPAIELLELLAVGIKPDLGPYADEATFLESRLDGRVELSTGVGVNEYYYRAGSGNTKLTMALSSSLVTELAPVILVLRHMKDFPVLILEEPEAHLHPAMQRHLARTIVRLIRKGLYVWITTHSENFAQQINNFIAIGESPKRAGLQKHLGYEEHEYLTHDDISGYQFKLVGDRSEVTELKRKPRGLVMPTFNREIQALGRETLYLEDETTRDP